jgi:AraC-like DNA-binding protein
MNNATQKLFALLNLEPVNTVQTKQETHNIKNITESMGLSQRDREFLYNLNHLFKINYSKTNYQRTHLASDMAISERQLQRKLKIVINKNPMQSLKEYRLQKAIEKLKKGYRISVTYFDCGFNSASYFSQCFKLHYGVSPKEFQQSCNEQNI